MREGLQYYHRYLAAFHLHATTWSSVTPSGTSACSPLWSARTRQRDKLSSIGSGLT